MLLNTFGETDCRYGKIVLVGTTIYACSLVADRIGYLYEPILGGGFPETGGLILTAAFGCVLWRDLSEAYKISLTYEVYSHQTELRLLAQKNHYDRLKEQMEKPAVSVMICVSTFVFCLHYWNVSSMEKCRNTFAGIPVNSRNV